MSDTASRIFIPTSLPAKAPARAAGCVLAGGRSRRMGTDKALLELDGKSLLEHATEHFAAFSEVLISAGESERYAFPTARVIADEYPGIGPIGGFISVLKAARAELVCFRPVDAPLVPAALHVLLAGVLDAGDAAVPTFRDKPEPLLACLSKSALPALEALAARGDYKAAAVFSMLDTVYFPLETKALLTHLGNPKDYLLNANDPNTFQQIAISTSPSDTISSASVAARTSSTV